MLRWTSLNGLPPVLVELTLMLLLLVRVDDVSETNPEVIAIVFPVTVLFDDCAHAAVDSGM
jgi:hypothetical protein